MGTPGCLLSSPVRADTRDGRTESATRDEYSTPTRPHTDETGGRDGGTAFSHRARIRLRAQGRRWLGGAAGVWEPTGYKCDKCPDIVPAMTSD